MFLNLWGIQQKMHDPDDDTGGALDDLLEDSFPVDPDDKEDDKDKDKDKEAKPDEPVTEPAADDGSDGVDGPDPDAVDVPAAETIESPEQTEESKEETPAPITHKYRGKEYTAEDLASDPKLITDIFTAANQQSNFQRLYEEEKRKLEDLATKPPEPETVPEQKPESVEQPKITPPQLTAHYQSRIDELKKDGWVEEDVADLYPNTVSGVLNFQDEASARIVKLEEALGALVKHITGDIQERTRNSTADKLGMIFDQIAAKGDLFAPLANEETREAFLQELQETINPMIEPLLADPSILENLWVAKNKQALMASAAAARSAEEEKLKRERALAVGEGSGARPAPKPKPTDPMEGTGLEDLL